MMWCEEPVRERERGTVKRVMEIMRTERVG